MANTMLSSSYSRSRVTRPCGVIRSIGDFADVDERDVVAVVGLVVVDVDAEPLGAERIGVRREQLRDLGVVDDLADLRADELGGRLVRLLVEQQVA